MSFPHFVNKLESAIKKCKNQYYYILLDYYDGDRITELEKDIIKYCNQHNYAYKVDYGHFWDDYFGGVQEKKYIVVYIIGG